MYADLFIEYYPIQMAYKIQKTMTGFYVCKMVTDCQKGLKQLSSVARFSSQERGKTVLFAVIMTQICMCMSLIIHVAACLTVGTDVSEISDSRSC